MIKAFFVLFLIPYLVLAQVEISLPAEIEVSTKSEYSLYDLVFLKQGTSEDLEELKKIPVSFLNKKGILEAVKDSSLKIKTIFENTFKVTVSSQVNKNEMQRKVTNHLTAECNTCIFEVQIQKVPFLNETNMSFRSTDFELQKGSFMLPLWDTKQTNKVFATGTWRTFKKVAISNKWLAQGHRLSMDDVKEELKEVTFLNNKLIDLTSLVGKQLARAIPANTIFTRDILTVEKVVKKGDMVRLIIKDGPFEIEISALAENDGQEGDQIKVKANQKQVSAKVISKDKVVSE